MSPKDETIKIVARLLEEKRSKERREESNKKYNKVKDVLIYLAFFGTCIFAPKATEIFQPLFKNKEEKYNSWKRFNSGYLKWTLHRLARQKTLRIEDQNNKKTISLTEKGKKKIMQYAMEELKIDQLKTWDGKWRLVVYDISKKKRITAGHLRSYLQRLGFLAIQESVYLFPYPCAKEIELLRTYFDLNKELTLITATWIENEEAYKTYFSLE